MHHVDVAKILALSVEERLRLIDLIWESLCATSEELPLGDAHRAMLNERLREHELFPDDVIPLDEAMALIRAQSFDQAKTQT